LFSEFFIVGLLIVLNSFFAMAEIAIVSARRPYLKQKAESGHAGAKAALRLVEDPGRFLSTVQTGITLLSVLASVFSGATIARSLGLWLNENVPSVAPNGEAWALAIVVAVVSYLTLFIGELVPKRIAITLAEPIAVRVAIPLEWLGVMLRPLVWLLQHMTEAALKLMRIAPKNSISVTEEEIKTMIAEGAQEGVFAAAEKKMLDSVMRLADRTVRGIMTPRMDMVWIGSEDSVDEIREIIRGGGYSRMPIARGDLDEVTGILHAKDMLNAQLKGEAINLVALQRPVLSVPDTTPVLKLLEQFKASGQHVAIVIDEYGTVEGLVTVGDILTAIAGALPEAGDDQEKPVRRADGSWLISGMTPIDEIETLTGIRPKAEGGDYHTLAGFMLAQFGHIPKTSDSFVWNNANFEVVDMDSRRIDKVLITPLSG
jgi:putative hemolysin